ncbi:MAG: hypothetical protein HYT93_02255 [Parcubacteria group bacterium]|nr:hypothetical protein [Parcubacteria group bacterium]
MVNISKKSKRLVLLDAHAILHRGYHAMPEFSSSKGEPTGALYGLSAMLMKIIADLKPDYIAACYDMPGPTFRHVAYEAYKAKRPKAEDDLIAQMNRSRDIFKAFNIPIYEKLGFEADDMLGTIVAQMKKKLQKGDIEIVIASGDMDTLQLVDDRRVQVFTLKKGINDTVLYDEEAVEKRFGFSPKLLPDFKGLRGDPSDNIVGIKGIGEKTATILIQGFGSIEEMYRALKKDEKQFAKKSLTPRIIKLLQEGEEEALFSKTLATIRADAPISFSLPEKSFAESFDVSKVAALFHELEFRTLTERAKKMFGDVETTEEKEASKSESISQKEVAETALALWLVNSNITSPTKEDILQFVHTDSFASAKKRIFEELKKRNLEKVYYDIELPLLPLLKQASERGIIVDTAYLKKLSKKYHDALEKLQNNIWKEAGERFNINSSQQLSVVLFDHLKLSLKGLRKTEGGARSTRESELLKLEGAHPIIEHILGYRELQKLLSTYVDNIPQMVSKDGRLHTTFIQTGTTTGRMSSKDPNMQNIPARGGYGDEIRMAFRADKGFSLVALDYSQIELRVLALLSKEKTLTKILQEGVDVHAAVAAHIFGVTLHKVNKDMRRKAKVINFGIIYGMGITSLQRSLKSTREEAQKFYDDYFKKFPGIAKYIEHIKQETAKRGYTETLFGRRRYIEGIHSNIPYIRSAAERMAVNAPIQGTATGDIIKLAIIRVNEMLTKENLADKVFLLLQVHDELVYEIKKDAVSAVVPKIKHIMEHIVKTDIPFIVDVSVGDNWGELKKLQIANL